MTLLPTDPISQENYNPDLLLISLHTRDEALEVLEESNLWIDLSIACDMENPNVSAAHHEYTTTSTSTPVCRQVPHPNSDLMNPVSKSVRLCIALGTEGNGDAHILFPYSKRTYDTCARKCGLMATHTNISALGLLETPD